MWMEIVQMVWPYVVPIAVILGARGARGVSGGGAMTDREKIEPALEPAMQDGGFDGADHQMWVFDQIVRTLAGAERDEQAGWAGWDEGVAS